MRICLIATELHGFGPCGGFGVLTRDIATGLAERGLEVYVTMPRKPNQKPIEVIDDIKVISYPSSLYKDLKIIMPYMAIYKMIDADIYHSEEPSTGTRLAQIGAPYRKHVITFQDPRTIEDWRAQWVPRKLSRWEEFKYLHAYRRTNKKAIRKADALFGQAHYACERAMHVYNLKTAPGFLPNPVKLPVTSVCKDPYPTVCFLGRWDYIKRPELFFNLAEKFPQIKFIAAGSCPNDPIRDAFFRHKYGGESNTEMPGWVESTQKSEILSRSWIVINTSTKECLPVSYLEACAYKCAILSHCNIDEFPSRFGYWAQKGTIEDFAKGLEFLIEHDRWRDLGNSGYENVKQIFEYNRVIDQHIRVYEKLLGR